MSILSKFHLIIMQNSFKQRPLGALLPLIEIWINYKLACCRTHNLYSSHFYNRSIGIEMRFHNFFFLVYQGYRTVRWNSCKTNNKIYLLINCQKQTKKNPQSLHRQDCPCNLFITNHLQTCLNPFSCLPI